VSYCFRLRFHLGDTTKLAYEGTEWVVTAAGEVPAVTLTPADNSVSVAEARWLVLTGSGYPTPDEATLEGDTWRSRLMGAFAAVNVGADFGDRAPGLGGLSDYSQRRVREQSGQQVLNDTHGLMVYESEPKPLFASVLPITAMVSRVHEQLASAVEFARSLSQPVPREWQTAYDLYSASFFMKVADARFMLLVMALEALIRPAPRPRGSRGHVEILIEQTRASALPKDEIESICGALRWLRDESIGQSGRQLVQVLGSKTYLDETPEAFFRRSYEIRSRLVHGAGRRPTLKEVSARGATLEVFVADVLSALFVQTVGTGRWSTATDTRGRPESTP